VASKSNLENGGGANEDASTRVVQAFHWTYLCIIVYHISGAAEG